MKCLHLLTLLPLCALTLAFPACTLDTEPDIPTRVNNITDPIFLSAEVTPDANNHFQVKARLSSRGNLNILHHGWVWSEMPEPTLLNENLDLGKLTSDTFTSKITSLDLGKVYYLRPFVVTPCDTFYGFEQCSFLGANITINTDTEIFQGADVQFSTSLLDNCSYLWDFGDGGTSILVSPKHTFDKGTGDVTARLTAYIGDCEVTKVITLNIIPDPFEGYWMLIPGGTFMMGCTADQQPECFPNGDENPAHQVTLDSFLLGKTEITQGQWLAVMGDNPSLHQQCGTNCPVENVSWDTIKNEFLPALYRKTGRTYRLPSEAEWEYAARGGVDASSTTKYAGSDSLDLVGWYDGNSGIDLHPVAQKIPNGYNLYDMSGNVWEWVEDDYHDDYTGAPVDGSAWIDTPRIPQRVFRGGSGDYMSEFCRIAYRQHDKPMFQFNFLGFRIARSL